MQRVLIANRGEIAVRIARTLRRMGIESVGVAHEDERDTPAMHAVDQLVPLYGAQPVAAYLDTAQLIEAARSSGADAVHPGYGFVSENAGFARAVGEAGLRFIGPSPAVMELMGDKIASRNFVAEAGFPVAPSTTREEEPASFAARAEALGFPLVLKASAGGGGKGMHIVHSAAELAAAAERASSEAARYFADGRIYAERYIERPRHIEVQVLSDSHGSHIHLFERECSIQRRFQKIIEESPSPALDDELRQRICEAGVGIARAANYENAGTVEFILAPDGAFYFLEMNTRLQVEHPVTEEITGLDLVELQVRIASGEALPIRQEDVELSGHAVECRIYAEDPDDNFAPATGRVVDWVEPASARFDSGITLGSEVTPDFDPMLAKLVTHGPDRAAAVGAAVSALGELAILGVTTNASYLARILDHEAFRSGETHTGFVSLHREALAAEPLSDARRRALLAAAALANRDFCERVEAVPEPYASMGAFRN